VTLRAMVTLPPVKVSGLQICLKVLSVSEILFADAVPTAAASMIAAVIAARSILVWWCMVFPCLEGNG
jgi:hypothetical protein